MNNGSIHITALDASGVALKRIHMTVPQPVDEFALQAKYAIDLAVKAKARGKGFALVVVGPGWLTELLRKLPGVF